MDNKDLKELDNQELILLYQKIKDFLLYLNKEKVELNEGDDND